MIYSHHHRRGTAEIETLILVPVLLGIIALIYAAYNIGSGRLHNAFNAEQQAYRDATAPIATPADASTGLLTPVDPFTAELPQLADELPDRVYVSELTPKIIPATNLPLDPITLDDKAAFPAPAWAYSAWPSGNGYGFADRAATQGWFADYTGQVRTPAITAALGLSPATPP